MAVDDDCNLYVTDADNFCIRKITPDGQVSTLAGSGDEGHADGLGTAASFMRPFAIAIDPAGTLYVTDEFRIRKITPEGAVTTLAGSGTRGSADGLGPAASFGDLSGLTVDAEGNVYAADSSRIRKISPAGEVTTLAGNGIGFRKNGIGIAASFKFLSGIALDASGNLLVAEGGFRKVIRRIEAVYTPPPWCPRNHHLCPATARARAVELVLVGHQLGAEPRFEGEWQSLLDAWVGFVMPHVIRAEYLSRGHRPGRRSGIRRLLPPTPPSSQ